MEAQRRNANRAAGGLNDEFLEEDDDALYPRSHSYGVENEYDVEDDFGKQTGLNEVC